MTKIKLSIFVLSLALVVSCEKTPPRRPIKKSTNNFYQEIISQNKKLNNREKTYIEHLIAKDTVNDYIQSNSGFWYYYKKKIDRKQRTPKTGDLVNLKYSVSDIHGNQIYKEYLRPYKVDKEDFIPALQDGIKLMKKGEIITFVVPSYRGYGVVGDNNKIGINQPIISTVEIINIKTNKNEVK